MLTSTHTQTQTSAPSKLLYENPSESKTPETEFYNNDIQLQINGKAIKINQATDSMNEDEEYDTSEYALSARATQIKQAINKQETVTALVLSPDGSSSEISYSTNSKQAHKILSGRPTIIGQLEEISVVIARSLDQSNCGPVNKHVLPVPLTNIGSYNGNYLLFKVDANGFCQDLKLSEYKKYVNDKKKETENAKKSYDGKQISIKSALSSSFFYDLTKVYIQSEIDKKSKTAKLSVIESVNSLISDFLKLDSSPMNDPDYKPEDELFDENDSAEFELDTSTSFDGRDWKEQLDDALIFVRERGRYDGQLLAERVCATFYELNGNEPSLNELKNIFNGIEQDLANEAEEDIEFDKNSDAQRLAEQLASNLTDNPDATELVEYSMKIVSMDLVSRAKAAYNSIHGQQPSKKALKRSVEKLALKLAEQAIAGFAELSNKRKKSEFDIYDPQNIDDQILARIDQIEEEQFNEDHFNLKMLTTSSKAKKGKYEAYDVYFSNFDKETENKNLLKAIDSFKMRNRRSPSNEEIDGIKLFLATNKNTNLVQFKLSVISDSDGHGFEEEKLEKKKNEKLLVTPVKKKKSAARFNVYFDDKAINQNTETALKWFSRFQNREPTKLEMSGIEQFIQTDKSELIECEFEVSSFDKNNDLYDDDCKETELLKMKTSKAVKKKTSTTYTLDFADKSRSNGDKKQALKWFERFNGRSANKEEQEKISQFVKADNEEQTIDID